MKNNPKSVIIKAIKHILVLVSLGCFLPTTGFSASVDYFLKIDGIDGESKNASHPNEIEIASWSWGASQSGAFATGGGAGSGKVSLQDFHFFKYIDKATGPLFIACLTRRVIPKATFTVQTPGTQALQPITFFTVVFTNLIITGVNENGTTTDTGDNLIETLSLNFTKIQWTYVPVNPSDGTTGTPVTGGWDVKANKGL
jgi:type VI secretion system secreted protein Hcp